MAITYLVDFDCPVKAEVPPGRFLRRLYEHDRANEALNRARRKQPDVAADAVKVRVPRKQPDGAKALVEVPAATILATYAKLEVLAEPCETCPARVSGREFGCRGLIDLPLSLRAEAWLMALMRGEQTDPGPQLLLNYLASNGITGHRPEDMRRTPGVFFDSRKTLVRRWGRQRVTANQLFEMLFMLGKHSSKHARFLLGLFDLYAANLSLERPAESYTGMRIFDHAEAGLTTLRNGLRVSDDLDDDASTRQLKAFFHALFLAHELECGLRVTL